MPESFRTFASSGIHGEGYVRFSTANSIENIKEAIDRIGKLRVEGRAAPGRSIARVLRPLAMFHRSAFPESAPALIRDLDQVAWGYDRTTPRPGKTPDLHAFGVCPGTQTREKRTEFARRAGGWTRDRQAAVVTCRTSPDRASGGPRASTGAGSLRPTRTRCRAKFIMNSG